MRAPTLAKNIAQLAMSKKAADVVIMDLRGLTSMTDFFVICSADSDVQIRAIADAVEEGTGKKGESPWHRESGSPNWVLLDFVDVVLHIFHKNTRAFYNLEKLWGDAAIEAVEDTAAPQKPAKRAARSTSRSSRSVSRKRLAS